MATEKTPLVARQHLWRIHHVVLWTAFWFLFVLGALLLSFGLYGVFRNTSASTEPPTTTEETGVGGALSSSDESICPGNTDLQTVAALLTMAQCTVIIGDVTVLSYLDYEGLLLQWVNITGQLTFKGEPAPPVHAVLPSLPYLATVGGLAIVGTMGLLTITLSSLTTVTGPLLITDNVGLAAIQLDNLVTVGSDVRLRSNLGLTTVALHQLAAVTGALALEDNPNLATLVLPSVQIISGDFALKGSHVSALQLDALVSVGGQLLLHTNDILTNLNLTSLVSVEGSVNISCNAALTSIETLQFLSYIGGTVVLGASGCAGALSICAATLQKLINSTPGGSILVGASATVTSCLP